MSCPVARATLLEPHGSLLQPIKFPEITSLVDVSNEMEALFFEFREVALTTACFHALHKSKITECHFGLSGKGIVQRPEMFEVR